MIVDEVDDLLRFLDDVGFQLACWLDVDGERKSSRRSHKVAALASPKSIGKVQRGSSKIPSPTTGASRSTDGFRRLPSISGTSSQQAQRGRVRKRIRNESLGDLLGQCRVESLHSLAVELCHQTASELQQLAGNQTDTLNAQLALSISEELAQTLDAHTTSISPPTHLSPIEPSLAQFSSTIHHHSQHHGHHDHHHHSQHQSQSYYASQRSHLDSYAHLHDEFTSPDHIPISGGSSTADQSHQSTQHHANASNNQLAGHGQSQSQTDLQQIDGGSSADCYQQQQPHQHAHHSHHLHNSHDLHHQHHAHQHHLFTHPNHQQVSYQHLESQWLSAVNHQADASMHSLTATDSTSLVDHVTSLSPANHQSLDHVQFSTPLYHHTYYNQQQEQLDAFPHLNEDFVSSSSSLTASSSSPLGGLHRLQQQSDQQSSQVNRQQQLQRQSQSQSQQQQQHQRHQTRQNSEQVSLDGTNTANETYEHTQLHQHTEQQEHPMHNHIVVGGYPEARVSNHHHHHNHHSQQHLNASILHNNHHLHHHHHIMPLMNGIEHNGVIIHDINLASASWSSPEDLYSI